MARRETDYDEPLQPFEADRYQLFYNQNVPKDETWYTRHREITGDDHYWDRASITQDVSDFMLNDHPDTQNPRLMSGMAIFCGGLHGWLFQQCVFQWVPSMNRTTRSWLFVIPHAYLWYRIEKWTREVYAPKYYSKTKLSQLLHQAASSARYDAWRQQSEGLIGGAHE